MFFLSRAKLALKNHGFNELTNFWKNKPFTNISMLQPEGLTESADQHSIPNILGRISCWTTVRGPNISLGSDTKEGQNRRNIAIVSLLLASWEIQASVPNSIKAKRYNEDLRLRQHIS